MCDLFLRRDRLDAGFKSDGLVHQRQIQLGPENINGLQFIQFWPHCYWSICLFSILGKNCQTSGDADWMSDLCQQSWLLLYAGNLSKVKEKMNFYLKKTLLICLLSGWCASFSPLANILCGVQSIVYRSSLSLLLPPKELGSVFAMLEILVALVPFLVTPIATWLYNFTLTTFPGTFCEFSKLFLFSITYLFRKLDSC